MGLLKKCNEFNEKLSGAEIRKQCLSSYRRELEECRKDILADMAGASSQEILTAAEQLFEESVSNPYSIAGYYLVYHRDSYLKDWNDNVAGKDLTVCDRKVQELLENIYASDIKISRRINISRKSPGHGMSR